MANCFFYLVISTSFVVGTLIGIGVGIFTIKQPTKNICPTCKKETEEQNQLKEDWEDQQKRLQINSNFKF